MKVSNLAPYLKKLAFVFLHGLMGVLATLALPPLGYFPLLFISLSWFVYQLDRAQTAIQAGWMGFWFGWGYFVSGLYWVGVSFLYLDHPLKIPFMLFSIAFLAAVLAFFLALAAVLAFWLWTPASFRRVITFASCWCVGEWVRGTLIATPFPWHMLGQVAGFSLPVLQIDSYVGPWTLSFLMAFVGASPMLFVKNGAPSFTLTPITKGFLVGLGVLAILFGMGAWRLKKASTFMTPIPLRLVQPNIPQSLKMDESQEGALLKQLTQMSLTGAPMQPGTVVVWPEAAWPYVVGLSARSGGADATWAQELMRSFPKRTYLFTGLERVVHQKGGWKPYNSLFALQKSDTGTVTIAAVYDKVHLVPFGEYLPAQGLLRAIGLHALATEHAGFASGQMRDIAYVPGLPDVEPLICYEIIFPHPFRGGSWILNVTNDAWFGRSLGPHQHLFQARMRAIEQGVPVVRVANSGITAVIGPYGHILVQLPLFQAGVIDTFLPQSAPATGYTKGGYALFFIHILVWLLYIVWFKRVQREKVRVR